MKDDTSPATKADIHVLTERFDHLDDDIDRILGFLVKHDKALSDAIPNHETRISRIEKRLGIAVS